MRARWVVVAATVALWSSACEGNPMGTEPVARASLSIRFAPPSRPLAAPPAEQIVVRLTGPADTTSSEEEPVDTTVSGAPGDTLFFDDLRPGEYELRLEGVTDPFLVWTSWQRVVVLPGTVSEPVVQPVPFEVDTVIVSSSLPLVGGAPLELSWAPVASALDYAVAWSSTEDFGIVIGDTVTTGTAAGIELGPPGVYYVRVAPRDSTGQAGYPVLYPDSIEVAN